MNIANMASGTASGVNIQRSRLQPDDTGLGQVSLVDTQSGHAAIEAIHLAGPCHLSFDLAPAAWGMRAVPADAWDSTRHDVNLAALLVSLRIEGSEFLPSWVTPRADDDAGLPAPGLALATTNQPFVPMLEAFPWAVPVSHPAELLWPRIGGRVDDVTIGVPPVTAPETSWLLL